MPDMNQTHHCGIRWMMLVVLWSLPVYHLFATSAELPLGLDEGAFFNSECTDPDACNFVAFSGPGYCLQVDEVAVHTSGALAGYTTYRVYALCENPGDFVNTVTGDSDTPLNISTTTSFYQNPLGADLAQNINPLLYQSFPDLAYDSWLTVGLEAPEVAANGEASVNTIGNDWLTEFSAGGNIVIDDELGGGWYVVPGSTNGIAGDDYRVLLGQFTTDGELSGELYIQYFPNGNPADFIRVSKNFSDACIGPDITAGCTYADAGYDCDGACLNDSDGDGVCDEFEVVGCQDETACNYVEGSTEPEMCTYPEVHYTCEGSCINDADGDGVCDEFEITGCQDAGACNYDDAATDAGTCSYASAGFDCDGNCLEDADNDGICDQFEVVGCQDANACNYDNQATDAGDCTFAAEGYDCNGNCISDADLDGICDEFELAGCDDPAANNYDSAATDNDGSCDYPTCNDEAACNYVPWEGPGYCVSVEPYMVHTGTTGAPALAGQTTYRIYAVCENADDFVSSVSGDATFPTNVSTTTSFYQDPFGANVGSNVNPALFSTFPDLKYDSWVTIGLIGPPNSSSGEGVVNTAGSSWLPNFEQGGNLEISDALGGSWFVVNGSTNGVAGDDGKVLLGQFTTDGDLTGQLYLQFFQNGSPAQELRTMVNLEDACSPLNFDPCTYPELGYDCEGACSNDADQDGVCDEFEIEGCTDDQACNFDANATEDNSTCTYPEAGYDCDGQCLNDADGDTVCDEFEIAGCQDEAACNFNPESTDADTSCTYPESGYDCASNCLNDVDNDGVCDEFEVAGCTDETACNFDEAATDSDGSCTYAEAGYDCAGSCLNDSDGDGVCNEFEIEGCQEESACNYNADATDAGECIQPAPFSDCDGNCLNDADGDGVCDELEVNGCTDETAFNWNPYATEEDGSCLEPGCNDELACNYEAFSSGFCLNIETVAAHTTGELAGLTTYRVYVTLSNPDDFVSAVLGDADFPIAVTTTTSFYQNPFGAAVASSINPMLISVFPELAYDSWVTIGLDAPANTGAGEGATNTAGNSWIAAFESGSSIDISDAIGGGWYALGGDENAVAGDDYRVLLGQFTTDGELGGALQVQIFENGNQQSAQYVTLNLENACSPYDESGCTYPTAILDCDGNCIEDADNDGVCDSLEIFGCDDATACNFDDAATENNGSCTYPDAGYDCDGNCINDADGDTVCDEFEVAGCQDDTACNFSADATDEDGSCTYAETGYDCDGNCINDADGDTVCDEFEIAGCQDETACNYNADATDQDGSCSYAETGYDCDGNCINDADGDTVCDEFEVAGCQDVTACNFNADATDEDGSCTYAEAGYDCAGNCINDADGDTVCDEFEVAGCQDDTACNYNAEATDEDGSCTYAEQHFDCAGNCLNDSDADGVCDELEVVGCQDATACDYNADATDAGACTYPETGYDCDGVCLADTDGDGICDANEIVGCQINGACNFNPEATDAGSCDFFSCIGCTDEGACNYDDGATFDDGSCEYLSCAGCGDAAACNYEPEAQIENNDLCDLPQMGYDCDGACLNDADGDGVCDEFEIVGCQDQSACNYNADSTEEGSCEYAEAGYGCDGGCLNDADADGVCDEFEIPGCTDETACNYDAEATDLDGSCVFAAAGYDCDGNCNSDLDGDGVCDGDEVAGCTFEGACNYDATATEEDGTCFFATPIYDCNGDCWNDADGDGICDQLEDTDFSSLCGPGTYWSDLYNQCLPVEDDCPYDLNNDGLIQLQDLLDFLIYYGSACN